MARSGRSVDRRLGAIMVKWVHRCRARWSCAAGISPDHGPIRRAGALILLLAAMGAALAVCAAEYRADPDNYRALLPKLTAGDTLVLAPGRYLHGLPVHRLVGLPGKPIVISGPRSQPYAHFIARPDANTVTILNSAYVEIRNLDLDGKGHTVAAVRAEGHADWTHHITLENLNIHDHGPNQAAVGISSFCPSWGWVIRNNVIVGAGTGMYLGGSDGRAPFVAGIIEHNLIADTTGYNLQIKHQVPRSRIDGMPEEKSVTIIRHNVFTKSANSSGGEMARPNLLVGHWPLSGPGADDMYAIYGNFFYQNPSEALFQGEGNVAFYSNVLVNSFGDAINIQPHNDVPRRIDIFHNTVLAANVGIRVRGGDPAYTQRLTANAVFAQVAVAGGEQQANRTGPLAEAAEHLADPFAPPGRLDLAPRPGKLTIAPFDLSTPAFFPDVNRDFDGTIYVRPIAGAYAGAGAIRRLLIEPRR
jgi:hypothetical protein